MKRRVAIKSGLAVATTWFLDGCRQAVSRLPGMSRVSYDGTFQTAAYNALPPVEDAHRRLQAMPNRTALLQRGLEVIEQHSQSPNVGLFLLHRHFACPDGAIMLEQPLQMANGEWVYVTAPTALSSRVPPYAPSRFMFVSRGNRTVLLPIEFSTDSLVRNLWREATEGLLLADVARVLEANSARNLLGIAIMPREHADVTKFVLEETLLQPPRSLVRWVLPREVDPSLTITTLWTGRRAAGCCTLQIYCEIRCVASGAAAHAYDTQCRIEHIGCV